MYTVCILTSVHRALDTRIFYKQARTLAKAGYRVILIAQHDKNEVVDGVTILALPPIQNRLLRIMGAWHLFCLALKQKASIYHLHDPELLPVALLLKWYCKRPVIYDVHEDYAATTLIKKWIHPVLRKSVASIIGSLEKLLADQVSTVITATDDMKQGFSGCRAPVISLNNYPLRQIALQLDDITADNFNTIIYTGIISKERGFETIIEALDLVTQDFPEATCLIMDKTRDLDWLEPRLRSMMEKLILSGNMKLIGWVPHQEVFRYIRASGIGWRPGHFFQEGISTKTLEYMACGKAVVSSDVSLTASIVRESECGILVDAGSASAHADAITSLLHHPDEARQMGENGRKAVLEKYNWENEAKKMLDLYQMLCRKPGVA